MPCLRPAPASQTVNPYWLWSRPRPTTSAADWANGVRPNSVVNRTSVSSSNPPAPEVAEQARDGPIDPQGLLAVVCLHVFMPVPVAPGAAERAAGEELHEPHAPFEQPAGDQAGPAEIGRLGAIHAVKCQRLGRLAVKVGDQRDRRLHPRGHLVTANAGGERIFAPVPLEVATVHRGHQLARGRLGPGRTGRAGNRSSIGSPCGRITTPW